MNLTRFFIPVQEVHVEAIVSDAIYVRLLKFVRKHPVICLVTAPNEPWCEKRIGADCLDPEAYKKILESRYVHLSRNVKMGLHTHLYHKYSLARLNYEDQFKKISEGKQFLESIGLKVTDFAAGWWNYDVNTIKVCEELGLTKFHARQKLCSFPSQIKYIQVHHWIHDFDL